MKKILLKTLAICTFAILFIGCTPERVYNVPKHSFDKKKTNQTLYDAIISSGKFLGWSMKKIDENTILGILIIRDHSAKIKISYDDNSYSINLLEAENLNYDKEKDTIHKNYNGWIMNLKNQIEAKVTPLVMNDYLKSEQLKASKYMKDEASSTNSKYKKIYDVKNKKFTKAHSDINAVTKKILAVGDKVNWVMSKQNDGFILAKIVRRVHSAVVRIDYDLNSYSITYITSKKLAADEHYNIHNNYNIWVKELEEEINFAL